MTESNQLIAFKSNAIQLMLFSSTYTCFLPLRSCVCISDQLILDLLFLLQHFNCLMSFQALIEDFVQTNFVAFWIRVRINLIFVSFSGKSLFCVFWYLQSLNKPRREDNAASEGKNESNEGNNRNEQACHMLQQLHIC